MIRRIRQAAIVAAVQLTLLASIGVSDTPWRYYGPLVPDKTSSISGGAQSAASSGPATRPRPENAVRPRENRYGYPIGQDPLFQDSGRPDWQPQHLERQDYERPSYDRPIANDAPIYRIESWERPAYQKPLDIMPNDNKPRYTIENYEAPGYVKPTTPEPYDRAPNYDLQPYLKPAYDGEPAYVAPYVDRPEYQPPNYVPDEYRKPREVPPPFIALPQ
jgi:hypothetical protein